MKKYFYTCTVIMGNISTIETEWMKNALSDLMNNARFVEYNCEKLTDDTDSSDYYYSADVRYTHHNFLSVLRFSEMMKAFCLFHKMTLDEHFLSLE